MKDYHKTFHFIVMSGLVCGLPHPAQWWSNAYRFPGGSMTEEYYQNILKAAHQYFCDTMLIDVPEEKEEEVLKGLLDAVWPDTHKFKQGFIETIMSAFEQSKGLKE